MFEGNFQSNGEVIEITTSQGQSGTLLTLLSLDILQSLLSIIRALQRICMVWKFPDLLLPTRYKISPQIFYTLWKFKNSKKHLGIFSSCFKREADTYQLKRPDIRTVKWDWQRGSQHLRRCMEVHWEIRVHYRVGGHHLLIETSAEHEKIKWRR